MYSQYRELQGFAQFGSDLDATPVSSGTGRAHCGDAQAGPQQPNACGKAGCHFVCNSPRLPERHCRKGYVAYESALYQYLDENVTAGGVMEAIRTTGDMKQDTEQQMKDVLAAFTADFIKNAG